MVPKTIWAKERVRWWWDECCRTHNCTIQNAPNVLFSSKMTRTAGLASGVTNTVKLSLHFLYKESEVEYDACIGHEVAHVFADRYYRKRCKHGNEWRHVMVAIGLPPNRCHQYQSTIIRTRPREEHVCSCGKLLKIGPTVAKRIRLGKKYKCAFCYRIIQLTPHPRPHAYTGTALVR